MSTIHLYAIYYSPWSERARWALDHHRVAYRYHEHVPMLGEPILRLRARGRSKATVPLLVDGSGSYADSIDIIERADAIGTGAPLVPDSAALREMRDFIEPGLAAARALVVGAMLDDPEALREAAMAISPKSVAGLLRPVAAMGTRFIAKKYASKIESPEANEATLEGVLTELRERLGGRETVDPAGFSALDIVAASLLQGRDASGASPHAHGDTARVDAGAAVRGRSLTSWRGATPFTSSTVPTAYASARPEVHDPRPGSVSAPG